MCGIFGVVSACRTKQERGSIERVLRSIALRSETRGRDSAGFAVCCGDGEPMHVLRAPMRVADLMRTNAFRTLMDETVANTALQPADGSPAVIAAIGHSRLVTNGSQLENHNNQPVVRNGIVGVHNGIVVNEAELWAQVSGEGRQFDIDTEALVALFAQELDTSGDSAAAVRRVSDQVRGSFSVALLPSDRPELVLGTNTGSLYLTTDGESLLVFASERYMLRALQDEGIDPRLDGQPIDHVQPRTGRVVGLADLRVRTVGETPEARVAEGRAANQGASTGMTTRRAIEQRSIEAKAGHRSLLVDFRTIVSSPSAPAERRLLENDVERLRQITRCSRCVLPVTFPFIEFDAAGVCNYCRNYVAKNHARPIEELQALVAPYKRGGGAQDCIVPFSGGRDSTFALHMIKTVLGMNPITITYDWGMVTDLARRNIARACGRLGVENVIVAADIAWKRDNIRKNIAAWLKRPRLGMIPLFMSGDKYFFYYTNRLKRQTGIDLNLWGINRLENTDFKTGFAGVPPKFDKRRIYSMSLGGHLRFWGYVGSNILLNPSLINSSNLDSLGSIVSRYLFPQRDYYSFFDYYAWNEREIEDVIIREYDWERAIDTDSTWRIGDGTASFYNYVYFTVAGFSENDTFRSNQIREGLVSRVDALARLERENAPRYENIRWYLDIVGLDYASTIRRINAIPKLEA